MNNNKSDELKIPKNASKSEIEKIIADESELLEQEQIKIKKLQKKMMIFGIILGVLIVAYIVLEIVNRS